MIWIVDDAADFRFLFSQTLLGAGYRVAECQNGREALHRLRAGTPDLVILDVQMPELDGWKTLEQLRHRGYTQPVMMITSVNDVDSRVRGLDGGADDYLGKPCAPAELLARVGALLRRAPARPLPGEGILHLGDARIDLAAKTATKGKVPLRLTRTDYAVLTLLGAQPGRPVSRDLILQRVWEGQAGGSKALDTHLWRLRGKLGDTGTEARWIQNVPAIGYMIPADAVAKNANAPAKP